MEKTRTPRGKFFREEDATRVNERIRVPEVLLIGANGEQHGVLPTAKAIEMAKAVALDLVEVAATARPPVCKIMDYGKYKFEQAKKAKAAKAKQHVIKIKEIKFHPRTDINDYSYRVKHAEEFLEDGCKVKASMQFRGREMAHQDYGRRLLDRMIQDLGAVADIEQPLKMEGNTMSVVFVAKKKKSVAKPKTPTAVVENSNETGE